MEKKDKIDAAKRLINDEGIMQLLTEYLLEVSDDLDPSLLREKTDEELGQLYRASRSADIKIKERFARIKNLTMQTTNPKPVGKS